VGRLARGALAAIGEPALEPLIVFLAQVENRRQSAAYRNTVGVIGSFAGDEETPHALEVLLRQFERGVDETLVDILLGFGRGEAAIRSKLKEGTKDDRVVILKNLNGYFAWPEKKKEVESAITRHPWEYEALLHALLNDPSPLVRKSVVSGMMDWSVSKYSEVLEKLITVLEQDTSSSVRAKAAAAVVDTSFYSPGGGANFWEPRPDVGWMAYLDKVVPSLIEALASTDPDVRKTAVASLNAVFSRPKRIASAFSKTTFTPDIPDVTAHLSQNPASAKEEWSTWWETNRAEIKTYFDVLIQEHRKSTFIFLGVIIFIFLVFMSLIFRKELVVLIRKKRISKA
jgi:hypothetical protein